MNMSTMRVALPGNGLRDSTRSSPRVRRRSSRFDDEDGDDQVEGDDEASMEEEQSIASPAGPSPAASHATPQAKNDYSKILTNPLIEEAGLINVQGFLRLTDGIAFQQVDTFPISYYAHTLGLDHVIEESFSLNGEDYGIVSAQQLLDRLERPSVLPQDSVFDLIPERLRTPPELLFWRTLDGEDDDVKLLEHNCDFDPAYASLLRGTAETVPISIPQHTEVLQIPTYRDPNGIKASVAPVPANSYLVLQRVIEVFSKYSEELEEYSVTTLEATEYDASLPFHIPSNTSTGWVASDRNGADTSYRLTFNLEWMQTPSQPCLIIRVTELPCDSAPLLLRVFLMSLVVEQNLCAYAILPAAATDVAPYFRLTSVAGGWLCDFRKCSARYASLRYGNNALELSVATPSSQRRRWIVAIYGKQKSSPEFLSAGERQTEGESVHLQYDVETGTLPGTENNETTTVDDLTEFDLLRDFQLSPASEALDDTADPLCDVIFAKQTELNTLETEVDPCLRRLLSSVVRHRLDHESGDGANRRQKVAEVEKECNALVARNKARENEFVRLEMEAVCDICADGEVEADNSILFCESCNVAVHQFCYLVDEIPQGDYYCVACKALGRDKQPPTAKAQPLPIVCELCPIRDGAFVRTDMPGDANKWVHVVCAKWHGLQYTNDNFDCVEDCTEVKHHFRRLNIRCELCLSDRGAMVACSGSSNCKKHFHVTCARAIGTMKITHGQNCAGPIEGGWSLCCPAHSGRDITKPTKRKKKSQRQLIEAGAQFPPEPRPPPIRIPFNQATGPERKDLLALADYETSLMQEFLTKRFYGVPCEICDIVDDNIGYVRCCVCRAAFCFACRIDADKINKQFYKCHGCTFNKTATKMEEENPATTPQCIACHESGGILRPAFANPMNRKQYWKKFPKEKEKSLFGKQLWIHTVCNFWTPSTQFPTDSGAVDLSPLVMSHGKGLTSSRPCILCGTSGGIKVKCQYAGCEQPESREPSLMHVTCARQAGLEVRHSDEFDSPFYCKYAAHCSARSPHGVPIGRCYRHGGNCFNLRAKLEDMIEIERRRAGKDLDRADDPMTLSEGQRIFFAAIQVMRILGWAWRWAEWWVDYDSSWEPLIEEGQSEASMTKEQLGIVESTRTSRCRDARKCRLAAFGASLRNRAYDCENDFDRKALDRALRAILQTKSLVGPLRDFEVDFFADWLGRAYRSKSRLLHFGVDKNVVSKTSRYCRHRRDDSLKFELGSRPIPGSVEQPNSVFDEGVDEVDSFMEVPDSDVPVRDEALIVTASPSKRKRDKRKRSVLPVSEPRKRHREKEPTNATKPRSRTGSESLSESRRDRKRNCPLSDKPTESPQSGRRASFRPDQSEPPLKPCRRCKNVHQGGAHCRFRKLHTGPNSDGSKYDPSKHTLTRDAYEKWIGVSKENRKKSSDSKPTSPEPSITCKREQHGEDSYRKQHRKGKITDAEKVNRPYYGVRKPCRRCSLANISWVHCRIVAAHWSQNADYTPFVDTGYEPFVMGTNSEMAESESNVPAEYPFVRKSCTRCNLARIDWRQCRTVKGHFSRNFDCTPSFPKVKKCCAICNANQTEWRICRIQLCHTAQNFDGTPFCVLGQDGELLDVTTEDRSKPSLKEPETPKNICWPENEPMKDEENSDVKPVFDRGLRRRRQPPDRLAPGGRIANSYELDSSDEEPSIASTTVKSSSRPSRSRQTRSRKSSVIETSKSDYESEEEPGGLVTVAPKENDQEPRSSIVIATMPNCHSNENGNQTKQSDDEEHHPVSTLSLVMANEASTSLTTDPTTAAELSSPLQQQKEDRRTQSNSSAPKREDTVSVPDYAEGEIEELQPPSIRHSISRPRRSSRARRISRNERKEPTSPERSPSTRLRRPPQYHGASYHGGGTDQPDSKLSATDIDTFDNSRASHVSQTILLPEASNSQEAETRAKQT